LPAPVPAPVPEPGVPSFAIWSPVPIQKHQSRSVNHRRTPEARNRIISTAKSPSCKHMKELSGRAKDKDKDQLSSGVKAKGQSPPARTSGKQTEKAKDNYSIKLSRRWIRNARGIRTKTRTDVHQHVIRYPEYPAAKHLPKMRGNVQFHGLHRSGRNDFHHTHGKGNGYGIDGP